MNNQQPAFSLDDLSGQAHAFPTQRNTLVCFVKDDCETCNTAAPVLEALHKAHAGQVEVMLVSQSGPTNASFAARHSLSMPVLDDRTCKAAFDWDIESVPSVFWMNESGVVLSSFEGFIRTDWETLAADMSAQTGLAAAQIDWEALPAWRPGCGSKHLDPSVYDKLRAEADGSPIRARKIDIASADAVQWLAGDDVEVPGLGVHRRGRAHCQRQNLFDQRARHRLVEISADRTASKDDLGISLVRRAAHFYSLPNPCGQSATKVCVPK